MLTGRHFHRGAQRIIPGDDDREDAERHEQQPGIEVFRTRNLRHGIRFRCAGSFSFAKGEE
jgi:hypothetical protein